MPQLKVVLATRAEVEALPEAIRALYVEKDGKFVLDADIEDVGGLKSALEKEREAGKKLTKELNQLRADLAGADPAKAKAALARLQELEDQDLIAKGEVDKLVAKRVEALEKAKNADIEARDKTIAGLNGRLSELLVDNELRKVAEKRGVIPTAIDDFVERGKKLYRIQDGKAVPLKGDDVVYSAKKANEPMPMDEWAEGLVSSAPHLFSPSSGSGAGPGGGHRGGGAGAVRLTREQAKDPAQYRAAKEQAAKLGQDVEIAD